MERKLSESLCKKQHGVEILEQAGESTRGFGVIGPWILVLASHFPMEVMPSALRTAGSIPCKAGVTALEKGATSRGRG